MGEWTTRCRSCANWSWAILLVREELPGGWLQVELVDGARGFVRKDVVGGVRVEAGVPASTPAPNRWIARGTTWRSSCS